MLPHALRFLAVWKTWKNMTLSSSVILSGMGRLPGSSALFWKATTFQEKQLFRSVLPIAAVLVPVQIIFILYVLIPQNGLRAGDLQVGLQEQPWKNG